MAGDGCWERPGALMPTAGFERRSDSCHAAENNLDLELQAAHAV